MKQSLIFKLFGSIAVLGAAASIAGLGTTGYTVYRATATGGPYTVAGTVNAPATAFSDPSTTLAYTQTHFYVVDATYQAWTARNAAPASVTTLNNKCN